LAPSVVSRSLKPIRSRSAASTAGAHSDAYISPTHNVNSVVLVVRTDCQNDHSNADEPNLHLNKLMTIQWKYCIFNPFGYNGLQKRRPTCEKKTEQLVNRWAGCQYYKQLTGCKRSRWPTAVRPLCVTSERGVANKSVNEYRI